MCTTSIVRFRFSLKDNSETLDTNIEDIESDPKFLTNLSTIRSIRSTLGVKAKNQLITEDINMNKGLSNGHQLNASNNIDSNLITTSSDIDSLTTSTTCSTTQEVTSESTMGLSNASTKDSLTQHLLLSSLKSGKPENGQRIDLPNISWNDLKANCLPQNETNSENQLELNCLSQNSSLNDQTVDQMIEEVLSKSESQVNEELTSEPILETTSSDEQQNESCFNPEMTVDSNKDDISEDSDGRTGLPQSESIDVKAEQMSLVRQTERLMRRIRRLQFRQTHKHLTKQMKTFVHNQQMVLGVGCQRHVEPNTIEDKMKLLTPEGVKGLSTSALVNLVKQLGSEGNHLRDYYTQQTPSHTSTPQSSGASQPTQTPTTRPLPNCEDSSLVKLLQKSQPQNRPQTSSHPSSHSQTRVNAEEKEAIFTTIDTLSAHLRHFESAFDSDATESSSGGESCDEMEEYSTDPLPQHSTPLPNSGHMFPMRKRSCWKWFVDRATIASRWTWLQAQVADLEFRIRQQNEMYRQLRATKGQISFGTGDQNMTVPTPLVPKPNVCTTTTSATTNSNPTQLPLTTPTPTESSASAPGVQPTNSESDSHNCMRTLALNSMRKRKLVRSMGALSGATRKAAKYSTIQCSCNGLPDIVWPCVLCNGRYSYVHVIDTDCMPHYERVSLLDSSCHPVLSLPNDVSLGLHFTELLKRETIQRPIPSRLLNKKRKGLPSPTLTNKFGFDSPKNKSPKRSQSVISSNKLRKKYEGSTKRRYVRRSGIPTGDGVWRKRGRPRERASSGSSRTESPIPSPVPSEGSMCGMTSSAPLHRRRRSEQQHAFDINNIVIPYSIAATTRVEKLQYKEIITPKWRLNDSYEQCFRFSDINKPIESSDDIDIKPVVTNSDAVEEEEDISDPTFTLRHAKCEEEERKRILAFMKGDTKSGTMRGRARVRFDSTRSDTNPSAGDGVFHNNDSTSQDSYTGVSTPVVNNFNNESNVIENPSPNTPTERRRNASLSSRRDDSIDEMYESVVPFELRTFPLNDLDFDLMSKDFEILCPIEENLESINDPEKSNEGTITANNSRAPTPVDSDGVESVVEHNDDNEDPEWEPKKL